MKLVHSKTDIKVHTVFPLTKASGGKTVKLFKKRKSLQKQNRIVMLLDFENLLLNIGISILSKSSTSPVADVRLVNALDATISRIAKEVGEVTTIIAFVPSHLIHIYGETLHGLGIIMIYCPKIKDKHQNDVDTVDAQMIEVGGVMISYASDFSYLCVGSGDRDFIPLIRKAKRNALEIMIVTGNIRSLSHELIDLADKKPNSKEKMVYSLTTT